MPAMTLLEWSQSPIRIFTLICVAQSIDQIRLTVAVFNVHKIRVDCDNKR